MRESVLKKQLSGSLEPDQGLYMTPELLRSVLDHSPDCIKVLDEDGNLISMNENGCRLMEVEDFSVLAHRPWTGFWSGEHHEAAVRALNAARQGAVTQFTGLCPTTRNTQKWWDVIISRIEPRPGQPVRFLCVSRDITERRADEEKLRVTLAALEKNAEELRRSNTDLTQFAFIASHDLKSPLNAIIQLADLLNHKYNDVLDDKGRQLTHYIVDSANKMRGLINDLLDYSRVLSGNPEDVAGAGMEELEKALENLRTNIENAEALVSYDSIPDVRIPPIPMTQLFQNLIGNALNYRGPEKPQIEIRAQRQGVVWLFSIKDNGIGIDPKYHEKIFEPFQRLHGHEYPGSGIGLALCRKVVERAGGRIWVESVPGQGATFYFTLPPE